jgi:hypothetical protein
MQCMCSMHQEDLHVCTCQISTHNMSRSCLHTLTHCFMDRVYSQAAQTLTTYALLHAITLHKPVPQLWLLPGQCTFTATVMDVVVQMYGSDVAPLTIGKQNLVMYVLRQLEKHFVVVNQFFRLKDCSHNVDQQSASLSLTIVTHTGITDVGLDTVSSHLSSAVSRSRHSCCITLCLLLPYLQSKLLCA